MLELAFKTMAFAALLIGASVCLWLSTPWGYKRSLYKKVIKSGTLLDNPQLLRALGLGGYLYGLFGGFWVLAATIDRLRSTGAL